MRLTQTVQKGGCAAKISADVLREVLKDIRIENTDPNVLVDGKDFDDAGIYKIAEDLAMVQTLDFFTPIVDTPKLFGEIAAANSLSDVYAMGGLPKTAMCILAFPLATLDNSVMRDVLQGALDKVKEANCSLVGGHSIDDDTLKFGLSVTGLVDPRKMWTNANSKVGDVLILTKALGTGTLTAGLKKSIFSEGDILEAIFSMSQLNNILKFLSTDELQAIHAATDITGFGLMGHAMQMSKASHVSLEMKIKAIPTFELAYESLLKENLTKAHRTNREYTKNHIELSNLSKEEELILFDPQTSGGLLLSVDPKFATSIVKNLKDEFKKVSVIGEVVTLHGKYIHVSK